jgi:two-component system LytT family response regulator
VTERIRVLIADDEPAGRRAVQLLLARDPEVQVVAQCRTGEETIHSILRHQPDLLFLDVQMPGGDGFDVLAQLPAEVVPVVLFVTAYEEYAIRAFGVHADDYVLKPFSDARFRAAVSHAKERLRQRAASRAGRAAGILGRLGEGEKPPASGAVSAMPERIAVRTSRGVTFLSVDEIDWIEARGDYVRIHSHNRTDLLRQPIGAMEEHLDGRRFVRIHRSAIVNLAKVRELTVSPAGVYVAILQNGSSCRLSRHGRERLSRILNQQI